jgi:hypothetical protein
MDRRSPDFKDWHKIIPTDYNTVMMRNAVRCPPKHHASPVDRLLAAVTRQSECRLQLLERIWKPLLALSNSMYPTVFVAKVISQLGIRCGTIWPRNYRLPSCIWPSSVAPMGCSHPTSPPLEFIGMGVSSEVDSYATCSGPPFDAMSPRPSYSNTSVGATTT